jgi:acetolactate synthase-1/2/3 large subunit
MGGLSGTAEYQAMKVSDYIVHFLVQQRVGHVFEVSGGMITHLLDSCCRLGGPQVISMRHEQAAGFAAEACARMTGVPGVALATSGPGATNLLTAIGSCFFDSTPAVFITGQVNRNELKGQRAVRQSGFQETDIVAIARPITKAAWLIESPEDVPAMLARAFATALGGRPGPVLVDIPMDVQRATISAVEPQPEPAQAGATAIDPALAADIEQVLASLHGARRPLLLVGGGLRCARAADIFRKLVSQLGVPVVNSLMAVDALPSNEPLRVGMIGTYGNRWANLGMGASDWLLVLGSRLDIRQTGSDVAAFKRGRTIFQVDVDAGEMNQRVPGCRAICSDLKLFLAGMLARLGDQDRGRWAEWCAEIAELHERWPDTAETQGAPGINPNAFMQALSQSSARASAFAVDVGQHQMWAAQSLRLGPAQRFLTSGGMGSMGFAFAAVGVAFACPATPVVVVAGDGGFQHNIHELQTITHHRLPIKMVVINNNCHGMVRQFQQSYFESRFQSTVWGYSAPDFAKVAAAYDIPGFTVAAESDIPGALASLWRDPAAPALLQVMIEESTPIFPKIAFGRPFTEMEPQAKPIDMEGT